MRETPVHDTSMAATIWYHGEGLEKPKQIFPPIAKEESSPTLYTKKAIHLCVEYHVILKLMNTIPRDVLEKAA